MSLSTPTPARYENTCRAMAGGCLAIALWCSCGLLFADTGSALYEQKCAGCHGTQGEGVDGLYEVPLYGDKSLVELTEYIDDTMPQDDPQACEGDEARLVAEFIFREFYSPQARQAKGLIAPPRIELTRLTAPQFRNAVADLVAHFTPPVDQEAAETAEAGLRGTYFQSDGMNKADKLRLERVDRRIDFDFRSGGPAPPIKADQFAIIWRGSIAAPETGDYEFRIRTENGARLFLNVDAQGQDGKLRDDSSNSLQTALIDAWVGSGRLREATGRVFLLGGRRYPLRLEFFKYLEASASIRLEWKPPHGVWRVIGSDHLSTAAVPRTWVVDTPLPADDRSLGYERGSSVSREWHTATTAAAVATAEEVVSRLPLLAGDRPQRRNRQARLGRFLARLASVAYRRPLEPEEKTYFRDAIFATADSPEVAVRRGVLVLLTSPHFLYTDLTPPGQPPSQHPIASRLAFALWDSLPDQPLITAAQQDELASREQIEAQARRMLRDPRARAKMRDFFHHWLEIDERDLAKDSRLYPEFDESAIADLRRSLELFLDHVMWSEESDYRELLLADYLFVNDRLRALYHHELEWDQSPVAAEGEFWLARCKPGRRSGILTHPYLLSAFAYHNSTSPIHRGVFLTRNVVGRSLKPPPVAVAFTDADFAPDLTMREKITELTREAACMSCHSVINPLGFALENFDPLGRWRTSDQEKPIDPRSQYQTDGGETLEVASARDIANFAVASEAARRALVTQLFRHLVKQNPDAYGPELIDELGIEFAADGWNMQNLLVRIAILAASHDETLPLTAELAP